MTGSTCCRNAVALSHAARLAVAILVSMYLVLSSGCFLPQTRGKAEEEERERILDLDTVADVTEVANVEPLTVQGVGLVTGLKGTGGGAPQGEMRTMLEAELRKQHVANPRHVLDSPDSAMVLVTGQIPAGARKGDPFDVQITLPPGSKTTSLRGGYLHECYLRVYDTRKHLKPKYTGQDKILAGHQLGKAKGHLLVGLDRNDGQEPNVLNAVIWEGAVTFTDRPYHFVLKDVKDKKYMARIANSVAVRLNAMFPDDPQKRQKALEMKGLLVLDELTSQINAKFNHSSLENQDTAQAATKNLVAVYVPWEYRHNTQRFILVARQVPLLEPKEKRQPYRQRLQSMLDDPAHTVRAAIRLEALGKESIPALRDGLKHAHPLVRFSSAEALAYLGDNSGVETLAQLAEQHYQLRAYCLTALCSLDHTICRTKLAELLSSRDIEVRYGAFRALQLMNASQPEVTGELVNNSFVLHRVAPRSSALVHFTLHRRAEVVLFGQDAYLVPPARFLAGKEFTVVVEEGSPLCTITRYHFDQKRESHEQCSLKLEHVLRALAKLGAEYPDVVEFLRQVEDHKCLNCAICLNAVPQPVPVEELAKSGLDQKNWSLAPLDRGGVSPKGPGQPVTTVSGQ